MPRNSLAKRILSSRLFLVVLAGILLLFVVGFFRAFWQDRQIRKEIAQLEQVRKQYEEGKIKMTDRLKEAESPAFLEKQARIYGGLIKPEEKSVMILEAAKKVATSSPQDANDSAQQASNYKLWWQYFFKSKN